MLIHPARRGRMEVLPVNFTDDAGPRRPSLSIRDNHQGTGPRNDGGAVCRQVDSCKGVDLPVMPVAVWERSCSITSSRLYVPSTNEATHPRCCDEGCPDWAGQSL